MTETDTPMDTVLDATTLPGVDATVQRVRDRATTFADQIADSRPTFDADVFTIVDAYVFGSVAAGEGRTGESDLDIALCVPAWSAPDDDPSHPAAYRSVVSDIATRIRDESPVILSDTLDEVVTNVDIWIAEPEYNAVQLEDVVTRPVYFPDTNDRLQPSEAAAHIRDHYDE